MSDHKRQWGYTDVAGSGLFSAAWYLAKNPDVTQTGLDPLQHYLQYGAAEGRDPGPEFCTRAYLQRYPDVAGSGMNPLLHYIRYGKDEGRDPSPLTSPEAELEGIAETIRCSGLFDASWYLVRYPSVAAQGIDPVLDYLREGYREGRNPGPEFDTGFYLTEYQDVAQSGANPLVHYLLYGRDEGRLPREMSARTLERKLWGGFSGYVITELETIKQSWDEPEPEKLAAAWALMVWYHTQGEFGRALENFAFACRVRETLGFSKKWALVAACCHLGLGEPGSARQLLEGIMKRVGFNPDCCLALSNTPPAGITPAGVSDADAFRLHWINRVFEHRDLAPIRKLNHQRGLSLDNLTAAAVELRSVGCGEGKISIVMPACNAAATIAPAIESLLNQTWRDIELIIVDDCSTDDTFQIAQRYAKQDSRVKAVRQPRNMGAYAARNAGARLSTGDFVTVHDCDDWSHPQKLEAQMGPLLDDSRLLGSFSFWVKVDRDMNIVGGWRPWGSLIEFNESSFLFRRSLLDAIGEWDHVRAAGDREFIWRAEAKYGKDAFAQVCPEAPLSFSLAGPTSLTQATTTHVKTVFYGLRRTYREAARWWHATAGDSLYLHNDGQGGRRPFPAPEAILIAPSSGPVSHVLISDFSRQALALGNRAVAVLESVARIGQTALFHWPDYATDADDPVDDRVFEIATKYHVRLLVPGETVDAETVVIVRPEPLRWLPDSIPAFNCRSVIMVDDQADGANDSIRRNILTVFGHSPVSVSLAGFLGQ